MKTILDGKLYDTETSEEFCTFCYSNTGDFNHVYEALHRSPNGKFFIEYSGGPMSRYKVRLGQNEVGGSSGIRLVTDEEAREFVQLNGTTDDYERAFGKPELG